MTNHRIFTAGITIALFGIGLVIVFAAQILLARALSIYEFGVFSTIYSAAAIASSLGTMGFDVSALRFFPNLNEYERRSFFNLAMKSTVLLTLLLALISMFVILVLLKQGWAIAFLTCGLIIVWAIVRLLSTLSRALGHFNQAIFIDRFCREGTLICFGFVIILYGFRLTLSNVLTVMFMGSMAGILLTYPVMRKFDFTFNAPPHQSQSIWLKATVGLLVINVLELTISRVEIILASILLNAESAAVTSAIVFIGNAIAVPTIAANVMIMPIVAKQYGDFDHRNLRRTLLVFLAFSLLGGATIGFAMLYDTAQLAGLFGNSIANEIEPHFLSLIILIKIAALISVPATPLILMSGKVRGLIVSYCIILSAKILGAIVFLPLYGLSAIIYILASGSILLAISQIFLMLRIMRNSIPKPRGAGNAVP